MEQKGRMEWNLGDCLLHWLLGPLHSGVPKGVRGVITPPTIGVAPEVWNRGVAGE